MNMLNMQEPRSCGYAGILTSTAFGSRCLDVFLVVIMDFLHSVGLASPQFSVYARRGVCLFTDGGFLYPSLYFLSGRLCLVFKINPVIRAVIFVIAWHCYQNLWPFFHFFFFLQ